MNKSNNKYGWLFATPYLIMFLFFFLLPLIWSFFLSMTDWNLMSPNFNFVFLDNFKKMLTDENIHNAFVNTIKYAIVIVPSCLILSFFYAYIIFNLSTKFKPYFTIAFFLPYLSSGVAISLVVKGLFSYDSPISTFFRENFGISLDILTNATFAFFVVCIMIIWKMSAYYFIFFLSSLESIGKDVEEAALLDGATGFTKIRTILIPNVYPAIFIVASLSLGLAFSIYTEPYMLTGGGPDGATTTWAFQIYQESFIQFNSGYGAAIAIVNAILVFSAVYMLQKLLRKWGRKYGWE